MIKTIVVLPSRHHSQIINMQDASRLIINHIRIMIEEAEHTKTEIKVSFHLFAVLFPCSIYNHHSYFVYYIWCVTIYSVCYYT